VLLIDQGNIRTGAARSVDEQREEVRRHADARRSRVGGRRARPGELVDFTTDHDKVREALLRIVGTRDAMKSRFNLSITESMAIYMHSTSQRGHEVILRECAGAGGERARALRARGRAGRRGNHQ
jgi:hypothetical protein